MLHYAPDQRFPSVDKFGKLTISSASSAGDPCLQWKTLSTVLIQQSYPLYVLTGRIRSQSVTSVASGRADARRIWRTSHVCCAECIEQHDPFGIGHKETLRNSQQEVIGLSEEDITEQDIILDGRYHGGVYERAAGSECVYGNVDIFSSRATSDFYFSFFV